MSTLAHSNVFMYPELLPACGFRPPAAFKRFFVNAEDVYVDQSPFFLWNLRFLVNDAMEFLKVAALTPLFMILLLFFQTSGAGLGAIFALKRVFLLGTH